MVLKFSKPKSTISMIHKKYPEEGWKEKRIDNDWYYKNKYGDTASWRGPIEEDDGITRLYIYRQNGKVELFNW